MTRRIVPYQKMMLFQAVKYGKRATFIKRAFVFYDQTVSKSGCITLEYFHGTVLSWHYGIMAS